MGCSKIAEAEAAVSVNEKKWFDLWVDLCCPTHMSDHWSV